MHAEHNNILQIGDIDADSDAPQLNRQKLRDDFAQVSILYLPGRHLAKSSHHAQGVARRGFSNSSNIHPNNHTKLKLYEFFLPHRDFEDKVSQFSAWGAVSLNIGRINILNSYLDWPLAHNIHNKFPIPGSRFPKNCVREISESHGGNSGGGSSSRDSSQQPRNYSRVMQLCSCRVALRQWR